ncbi:MAG: serine hydrolase, partial [Sphingosinicella sp.]|uniref:serine hydrolase n=1 Tax=Sphingosinicella sp. TaxID=1917971 RepID=UPI004037C429
SNGGLNAPMTDMARYLAFLIGDPAQPLNYDLVLQRSSLEEMWRPAIALDRESTEGRIAVATHSGLNFFVTVGRPVRIVGHSGDQNGFRAWLSFCPEQRAGSLLAFNTTVGASNDPPDARIALATDRLCEALAR